MMTWLWWAMLPVMASTEAQKYMPELSAASLPLQEDDDDSVPMARDGRVEAVADKMNPTLAAYSAKSPVVGSTERERPKVLNPMHHMIHQNQKALPQRAPHEHEHKAPDLMQYTIHQNRKELPQRALHEHEHKSQNLMRHTTHQNPKVLPLRALRGNEHKALNLMHNTIDQNQKALPPRALHEYEHKALNLVPYTTHQDQTLLPLRALHGYEHKAPDMMHYTIHQNQKALPLRALIGHEHKAPNLMHHTIHQNQQALLPRAQYKSEHKAPNLMPHTTHRNQKALPPHALDEREHKAPNLMQYTIHQNQKALPGALDEEMRGDEASLQQISLLVFTVTAEVGRCFDRPWEVGTEPVWWQNFLQEGFDMQRRGYCMWTLADKVEARVRARGDSRYAEEVANWVDSWSTPPTANEPVDEGEYNDFVEDAEVVLRQKWLAQLCPVACNNWALERYFTEFGLSGTVEGERMRAQAEEEEARAVRLSRSRTPQRRGRPRACGSGATGGDDRRLLSRRDQEEDDETALVVKKFLLKKKQSKTLRRLIDNPVAWKPGPGVTVTTSTRRLVPREGRESRECSGSSTARDSRRHHHQPPWSSAAASSSDTPARHPPRGSTSDGAAVARDGPEQGPEEELDELGAAFLWRTMLGLDTDSDYEDEEPTRMPGFVNEPAHSTVFETLMDKTPEEFALMVSTLPQFIELLHNDLRAITDSVGHQRGLDGEEEEAGVHEDLEGPDGTSGADTSTGTAVPPEIDTVEVEIDETEHSEEVEVEVAPEGDETLLVQVSASAGKARPHHSAHSEILRLRDWLEDRWAEGHQIYDMIQVARAHLDSILPNSQDRARGQEWLSLTCVVVPKEPRASFPTVEWAAISPSQREWVRRIGQAILQQVTKEKEEEKSSLMQRTLTGVARQMAASPRLAADLHTELQNMPQDLAQRAAGELLRRLRTAQMEGPQWGQIEAVLVTHALEEPRGVVRTSCEHRPDEWIHQWFQKVTSQRGCAGSVASSSNDPMPPPMDADQDRAAEDREREEEKQRAEDEELYRWHQKKAAQDAQMEDRAIVLAHMGWSIRSKRKRWLTVEIQTAQEERKMTVQLEAGQTAKLLLTPGESVENEYHYRGQVQDPVRAQQQILASTEAFFTEEAERSEKQAKVRQQFNTDDPGLRPYYEQWERGLLTWEMLVEQVGEDAANFIKVAAAIDPRELETQPVPIAETQLYNSSGPVHGECGVHPDSVSTVPLGMHLDGSSDESTDVNVDKEVAQSRDEQGG